MNVLVYLIPLKRGRVARARLAATLSRAEIERASRFRSPQDRDRFVVAHGETRRLLGRIAGVDDASLGFATLQYGKPVIERPAPACRWQFNLSHSGDYALLAVASEAALGVDIEYQRRMSDQGLVAKRFFSAAEQQAYASAQASERQDAFFSIWTRKEAVIKALGLGLSMPLDEFDVCRPGAWFTQPAFRIERVNDNIVPQDHWQVSRLDVPEDYSGAIAIQTPKDIRIMQETAFI